MGGKKKNKTKKTKSTKLKSITPGMSMKEKAKVRHHNFKVTGVQTHGGTRKSYSKSEARKIGAAVSADNAAGGTASFASVTRGAKDPRNRADTSGIKVGPMKEEFTSPLGGMSYSQFEGAMKSNPFGPSPAGADRGISFSDAMRATRGGGLGISRPSTGGFNRRLNEGDLDMATLPGFSINKKYQDKTHYDDEGNLKKSTSESRLDRFRLSDPDFEKKYNMTVDEHDRLGGLPQTSGGDLIAASNVGGLTGLGATPVPSYFGIKSPESFGAPSQEAVDRGTTTGGLNFGLSAEESDRLGRVFRDGPSPRMLSEGGDLRFSDMYEAAGPGATLTKGINFVKNKIPLVNRFVPDMKINSVAEEAQRKYLGFNPNLPANVLKQQDRRRPNNNRTVYGTQSLFEDQPYYQPVQNAPATAAPVQQSGVDPNRLLQIQQQAYAQAFNPMVVGGYNPTFRFGASSPTIDYSSYFNY